MRLVTSVLTLLIFTISISFTFNTWAFEGILKADLEHIQMLCSQASSKLTKKECHKLKENLKENHLRVFRIKGKTGYGTGVFIGPNGEFVTDAHVLETSGHYELIINNKIITTNNADNKSYNFDIHKTKEYKSIKIPPKQTRRSNSLYWDITFGQIENFKSPGHFELYENKGMIKKNLKVISLGYPGPTYRKDWRAKYNIEKIKEHINGRIVSLQSMLPYISDPEKKLWYNINIKAYSLASKNINSPLLKANFDYEVPSSSEQLYFSIGKLHAVLGQKIISDIDTNVGMSGGPIINILDNKLVGLNQSTLQVKDNPMVLSSQQCYLGASFGQAVTMETRSDILKRIEQDHQIFMKKMRSYGGIINPFEKKK